ncbi:MAG: branched-chain amino acid ABC transporter permease [Hyphomicrobiales bacterium]|nr:branched-chain amino acid ABC transporter permease [Hyphomicrobiales bacterium]
MRVLFKQSYDQDIRIAKHRGHLIWYGLLLLSTLCAPLFIGSFYLGELSRVMILALAGLGLMFVTGFTGQVSLGHAAFVAAGAYANAWALSRGWPSLAAIPFAGFVSMLCGLAVAVPASRMSGIYLAIGTLAFAIIVEDGIIKLDGITGGNRGMAVEAPVFLGFRMWESWQLYYLCLFVLVACIFAVLNFMRSPVGRAMIAVRDSEVSARSLGVKVARTKIFAFAVSAAITGFAGALFSHYLQFISPEIFGVVLSIQLLLMIVVGGLGTVHGAIFGAALVGLLETGINLAKDYLPPGIGSQPGLEPLLFGIILVGFILFEPQGVYGRWVKIRSYFELFPLYRRKTFVRQRSYLKTDRMQ